MAKLIIANWKLNPATEKEAELLASGSDIEGLVLCPPFVFLEKASAELKKAQLGAQDLFWEGVGPYTGEISGGQLKEFGVKYVIIGHSERRQNLGETDEMVAKKIKAAVEKGLIPILCVGETKEEHDAGRAQEVVERELTIGLSQLTKSSIDQLTIVCAYEPIWAIGTGNPDTPENAVAMAKFIKKTLVTSGHSLSPTVIYGGSVTSKNANDFFKHSEIEGALVGGASLKANEIKVIVDISRRY
ncbi:MAG: triose-phosphate isomerase [bacterium]|nr:triose-phosphate isomerase [bacterium]